MRFRASPMLLLLLGGSLIASSLSCEREPRALFDSNFENEAQVTLFNATHDVLQIRFQSLRRQYVVDCDLVEADPSLFLRETHLSNPTQRFVLSGTEVALDEFQESESYRPTSNRCRLAFLNINDDRLDTVAVSWPRDLPWKSFYTDVDAPSDVSPEEATVIAEVDYSGSPSSQVPEWRARPCEGNISSCSELEAEQALRAPDGADYHWSVLGDEPTYQGWTSSTMGETPLEDPEDGTCRTGRNDTPLTWSSTSSGRWQVASLREQETFDENGEAVGSNCYELELTMGMSSSLDWNFCGSTRLSTRLDPEALSGNLFVEFFRETQFDLPPSAYENLTIDIRRETDSGEVFQVETIELIRGQGVPDHIGLTWEAEAATECDVRREITECNQMILPSMLRLQTATGNEDVSAGDTVFLDSEAGRRLELIRSMHRVVFDSNCSDERLGPYQISYPGTYMELIYYAGVTVIGGN